jgi:hypothetical protein
MIPEFFIFASALSLATVLRANPEIPAPKTEPVPWTDAFRLQNDRIAALIYESPTRISLRGFFPTSTVEKSTSPPALEIEIDWLGDEKLTNFRRSFDSETGTSRVSYRIGRTTVTRTAFASTADDAIFLHFIADQPGALSFQTRIVTPDPENAVIQNRTQLLWREKNPDTGFKAALWVLPFESDVERDGNAIVLRGEGECILIVNFARADDPAKPISDTLRRLGDAYDPGHQPPDPVRIWHSVLAKHSQPAK